MYTGAINNIHYSSERVHCPSLPFMIREAVDTSTDKTLWVSKPNTCNTNNFLILDNSIICGFGDSGKPDFINVLNRFTGVQKQQLWVANAPNWLAIGSDGRLYVSLYDKHVAFKITR